jgi:hypothetical protein
MNNSLLAMTPSFFFVSRKVASAARAIPHCVKRFFTPHYMRTASADDRIFRIRRAKEVLLGPLHRLIRWPDFTC